MSHGLEAAFAHQADQVMDRQATFELIQLRLAQEAAAASTAGATVVAREADIVPMQTQ